MTVKQSLFMLAIPLIALPFIAGGITAVNSQQTGQISATATIAVSVAASQATAVPQTKTSSISALGSVEANAVTSLYFPTTGKIKGVYAVVGDYINAGEVLADLDSSDAWNTYNQAKLSLESAQLAMTELMAPPTSDELAVAKANVASAQAAYSSVANATTADQITQYQIKVDQAQASLTALQTERAHMDGTDNEITLQEAKIGQASFNLQIAKLQLEEAQKPNSSSLWSASVRIQLAKLQLDQLQVGPTETEIKSAQLKIDSAQAKVDDAQNALLKTQLIAPTSGYITAVNISEGGSANSGTAIMEISDTSKLQMTVPVNELDIKNISVGESAAVQLDALTDVNIVGTVDNVGWVSTKSSDGIVTYDVRVVLNTTDARVRIGMMGEVAIGSTNS